MEDSENTMKGLVAVSVYPIMIIGALLFHEYLKNMEAELVWATYLPVVSGAGVITLLEFLYPCRKEWRGDTRDWFNDWLYMLLVQVALPKLLQVLMVFFLLDVVSEIIFFPALWPHSLPVGLQALLMVLAADFLRYWLHRWSHENVWLWRLHAVHHSPHKLYWVNVARFHPLEKSIQFFFDTLPFIFLGVSPEVLGLYTVFYSINGFFQHSNIDVRLGILNYLISGPELHRWHHSMWPEESNQNYGNNLIIWDLIFGTRFLPAGKEVERLGLPNRNYPLEFWKQLSAPFKKGMERG